MDKIKAVGFWIQFTKNYLSDNWWLLIVSFGILYYILSNATNYKTQDSSLHEVWAFIKSHMEGAETDRAIVLLDGGGSTMGELWDKSLCDAHWETPSKMRPYWNLAGFHQDQLGNPCKSEMTMRTSQSGLSRYGIPLAVAR